MPLVRVTDGDAVIGKGPELFDQAIIQLFFPLAGEETFSLLAIGSKLSAVTPFGIQRVGERNFLRVAAIPTIFMLPLTEN